MRKWKALIGYECMSILRAVAIFYGVMYGIIALFYLAGAVFDGEVMMNGLEFASCIFIGVLGLSTVKENFNMLMQNGFTRREIFVGAVSQLVFVALVLGLCDAVISQILHRLLEDYNSIFGPVYGYEHVVMNVFWCAFLYAFFGLLGYMAAVVTHRVGPRVSLVIGVAILASVVAGANLLLGGLSADQWIEIGRFLSTCMGILPEGGIVPAYPLITFGIFSVLYALVAFIAIRRLEWRK